MALSVVQHTKYSSGTVHSATGTIVYNTAPTTGNLLLVGVSYQGAAAPVSAPVGWSKLDELENGTTNYLTTYTHVVGVSETNSYVFTTAGNNYLSIAACEITGQAAVGSFINGHAIGAASANPQATPAVTPSVISCLAIAFIDWDDGASLSGTAATVGAGWTVDENPQPNFHSIALAHKTALTADTTTPVNATVTWQSSPNVSSTILITSVGSTTLHTLSIGAFMGLNAPAILNDGGFGTSYYAQHYFAQNYTDIFPSSSLSTLHLGPKQILLFAIMTFNQASSQQVGGGFGNDYFGQPYFSQGYPLLASPPHGNVLQKRISHVLTAIFAPFGTMTKFIGNVLASSLGLVTSITKFVSRNLLASSVLSGFLARIHAKTFSGLLSLVGAYGPTRTNHIQRALLTPLATINNLTNRSLAALITQVTSLSRQTSHVLNAVLTSIGTNVRAFVRTLSGALSFVGNLVSVESGAFVANLSASLSLIGNNTRFITRALSALLLPIVTFVKQGQLPFAAGISTAATISRSTGKALGGSLQSLGAFTKIVIFFLLSATLSTVGTFGRFFTRVFSGNVPLVGQQSKTVGRTISANLIPTSNFVKKTVRSLAASMQPLSLLIRSYVKILSGVMTQTATMSKQATHTLSASIIIAGTFTKIVIFYLLSSSLNLLSSLTRNLPFRLSASLTSAGSMVKKPLRSLASSISTTGIFKKLPNKAFNSALHLTAVAVAGTHHVSQVFFSNVRLWNKRREADEKQDKFTLKRK